MNNPEIQTTQQRLTKKGAIKNGQSRDPDNTEQRLIKKGAIKNGQSRDPENTEQRLTKKGNQEWTIQRPRKHNKD
jgi:preprotein translocase subunit Sec63